MRTRTKILVGLMAALVAGGVVADEARILGRDVAREGRLTSVEGSLEYRDNEWFVDTGSASYQLLMGRYGHEQPLPLTQGAAVDVRGFVVPENVAPIVVATQGDTAEFWHEARHPLWAGSGERRNAAVSAGEQTDEARGLAVNRERVAARQPEREAPQRQPDRREQQLRDRTPSRLGEPEAANGEQSGDDGSESPRRARGGRPGAAR